MSEAGPSQTHSATSNAREESELWDTISRLMLHDLDQLEADTRKPYSAGNPLTLSDAALAAHLAREELNVALAIRSDNAIASQLHYSEGNERRRIDQEVRTDLLRGTSGTSETDGSGWLPSILNSVRSWLSGGSPDKSSLVTGAPRPRSRTFTGHTCVICQERIYGEEVEAPCGHHYDTSCILDLFRASTRDESLFPPRCCRLRIQVNAVKPLMNADLLKLFENKSVEFSTLKRVYCSNSICSRFLGPRKTRFTFLSTIICCPEPTCKALTCSRCKGRTHPGVAHSCQAGESDRTVLDLGVRSGWARCPGCEQMIELDTGCYHMTCRCKTEFCYTCRAPWKTCSCAQWDERRLFQAAEVRVDARLRQGRVERPAAIPPDPPATPRPHVAPVADRPARVETTYERVGRAELAAPVRPAARSTCMAAHKPPLPYRLLVSQPGAATKRDNPILKTRTVCNSTKGLTVSRDDPPAGSRSTHHDTVLPKLAERHTFKSNPPRDDHKVTSLDRQRLIREAAEELRINHECNHKAWVYRRGGGTCENCHHHLPLYLFNCRSCQMNACNRCRRNRL